MHVLGLSALNHDSTAALLADGAIVAAIEEGKLARTRTAEGIPRAAIQFCLQQGAVDWKSLDRIAIASRPALAWRRQIGFRARLAPLAPLSSGYFVNKAFGEFGRELNNMRILTALAGNSPAPADVGDTTSARIEAFDHHLCHAASAFYASPFEQALIVTLDEQGDGRAGFVALGEGAQIRELDSISLPNSLAWVYTRVTQLLGFRPHNDEHKTQWLSLTGEPVFANVFLEMLRPRPSAPPQLSTRFFSRGFSVDRAFAPEFFRSLGITLNGASPASDAAASGQRASTPAPAIPDSLRANIAASLQQACATLLCEWLDSLRRSTKMDALCLAGGLFLNSLLVSAIESASGFEKVFVQPAAGSEGTSLGAAWLCWHHSLKKPRVEPMAPPCWGPGFSNQDIKSVLDNCKVSYAWCESDAHKIDEALRLLEAGKIVAWYQGNAEFGPRALGNRSLLASPWAPYVKENLNDYVKHRESFRPFALSICAEDASEFFDCSPNGRFMTTMAVANEKGRKLLGDLPSGFLLPGNLVRLHTVSASDSPLFWRLLKRSGEKGPAPMLVNTSFNLFAEPLVVRPRDAVRSYFCSGADALIAGSFLLVKN
jgi:carbamoyltransferase